MPENSSDDMRHLIQALLVAYAQPKLNLTIDHTTDTQLKSNIDHPNWYRHLTHPRLCSSPKINLN